MIQQAVVDVVVAGAALWLVWTFAPSGLRGRVARLLPRGSQARRTAASPLAAEGVEGLQAVELDGGRSRGAGDCEPGCGCG